VSKPVYSQLSAAYLLRGLQLITTKGLKRFVVIPVSINLIIFAMAFIWLLSALDPIMMSITDWLPGYVEWLIYLLWPIAVVMIILTFALLFSTLTTIIAAPFNGLLAEKTERYLTGEPSPSGAIFTLITDAPRMMGREIQKLMYYVPRAIGFFLIFLLLPVVGQLIWLGFVAWMMAIQYLDYPFDNHRVSFNHMRDQLGQQRSKSFGFGFSIALLTMVPIINLIIMPVAVCGATALWVDHFRKTPLTKN